MEGQSLSEVLRRRVADAVVKETGGEGASALDPGIRRGGGMAPPGGHHPLGERKGYSGNPNIPVAECGSPIVLSEVTLFDRRDDDQCPPTGQR
jgi:hypothetical protein